MNTSNVTINIINRSKYSSVEKNIWNFFLMVFVSFVLSSCASSPRFTKERTAEPKHYPSKAASNNTSGKATVYTGIASYYAHDFNGKKTANGETFDMRQLTAAHRSFPFNTKVRVTNLDNGKSCIVRVNDRGPFKLERIMDLSLGAAEALDMIKTGTASVQLEVVEWGSE
jgi:rare lipoprotein A